MGIIGFLFGGGEKGFDEGVREGIVRTLANLEGSTDKSGRYMGPVPPELRTWIATVRERMALPANDQEEL